MTQLLMKMFILARDEEAQDLVEYALLVALIAFGAVASIGALSTEINSVFALINSDLTSSI